MEQQKKKRGNSKFVWIVVISTVALGVAFIAIFVALMFTGINNAFLDARHATAEHLADQLGQATKAYELDQNAYPPGDGNGTIELGASLAKGPGGRPYFEFISGMRDTPGNILNPVFAGTGGPESIFYYRNNSTGEGRDSNPARYNISSFDLWGYGSHYQPEKNYPSDAWEINNWE